MPGNKNRKKFVLIGMAAVVALLLALGLGTTVFAQDGEDQGDGSKESGTPYETFVSKVADKLGLEYDVVYEAMQAAHREMMDEALQKRLQEAVEEGLITQEQADEILAWMKSRPEALDQLGGFGFPGRLPGGEWKLGGGPMMGGHHRCRC